MGLRKSRLKTHYRMGIFEAGPGGQSRSEQHGSGLEGAWCCAAGTPPGLHLPERKVKFERAGDGTLQVMNRGHFDGVEGDGSCKECMRVAVRRREIRERRIAA